MGREELEEHVQNALEKCQEIILNHPNVVLSEADFERLLCKCISNEIEEVVEQLPSTNHYSVHTQISHYIKENGKYKIKERVDILILDESLLEECKVHKKDKYFGPSIALELKYLHIGDSVNCVEDDFDKWKNIKEDSSLYVVVLLEANNEKRFNRKKDKIMKFENKYSENRQIGQNSGERPNSLHSYVMIKKK